MDFFFFFFFGPVCFYIILFWWDYFSLSSQKTLISLLVCNGGGLLVVSASIHSQQVCQVWITSLACPTDTQIIVVWCHRRQNQTRRQHLLPEIRYYSKYMTMTFFSEIPKFYLKNSEFLFHKFWVISEVVSFLKKVMGGKKALVSYFFLRIDDKHSSSVFFPGILTFLKKHSLYSIEKLSFFTPKMTT